MLLIGHALIDILVQVLHQHLPLPTIATGGIIINDLMTRLKLLLVLVLIWRQIPLECLRVVDSVGSMVFVIVVLGVCVFRMQ